MTDAILITEIHDTDHAGENIESSFKAYTVSYIRTRAPQDLEIILSGKTFAALPDDVVVKEGPVPPPDGTPLGEFDLGHAVISSQEEAIEVARAALINPKSAPRLSSFSETTPIYFWMPNQKAERQ